MNIVGKTNAIQQADFSSFCSPVHILYVTGVWSTRLPIGRPELMTLQEAMMAMFPVRLNTIYYYLDYKFFFSVEKQTR